MKAIELPNLPRGRVSLLAVGERYRERLEKPLSSTVSEVLWLPDNSQVDSRLAGHADLMLIHLGRGRVVCSEVGDSIVNNLTNRGFEVTRAIMEQRPEYPFDCNLNGCSVGDRFIHRHDVTDPAVLRALPQSTRYIDVAQGYSKCSVCVVDEHSVITSDAGIAKSAALYGIEALEIEQGFIELAGFDSGFIGGSAFKLSEHELAFTGNLDAHPDRDRIIRFLAGRGISPVFLTERPIFDIGSAIPLLEK